MGEARQNAEQAKPWAPHLLPLLRPHGPSLTLAALAMIGDSLLTALRPWPLKVVIDRAIGHKPTRVPLVGHWLNQDGIEPMHIVYGACLTTLAIALSTGLLTYFFTRTMGDVARRFTASLRRALFAHLQRLSLGFHDRQRTGDLLTRLMADIGSIQEVVAQGSILFLSNASLLATMLGIMLWLNWKFALAALSVSPILFATILYHTRRVRRAARVARTSDGLLASLAQETLSSIRVVQGLAQEKQQDERFHGQSESSLRAYLLGVGYQARVAPLVDILAAIGLAIVMWYGVMRVRSGELTTGDVVIFFAYVTNLYAPMKALSKLTLQLSKASVGAERIAEVLSERSEVTDRADARPAPTLRGGIEFRNLAFGYGPGKAVLDGISLTIAPGERVAIVGATGAGKSTLASLVPRFYDPQSGTLLLDGHDVREYTIDSVRDQISMVLQDSLLFSGTVRDNIAFGKPEATDQDILAAATAANADEFIRSMPEGYATLVSERGTTLSGGQKQRIAIARAILRASPILILDEPTSGLDAASERAVMEAVQRVAQGRTTLMIAHRMATVRFADRIVVLERGRIIEEGTHAALVDRNGAYAQLHQLST